MPVSLAYFSLLQDINMIFLQLGMLSSSLWLSYDPYSLYSIGSRKNIHNKLKKTHMTTTTVNTLRRVTTVTVKLHRQYYHLWLSFSKAVSTECVYSASTHSLPLLPYGYSYKASCATLG